MTNEEWLEHLAHNDIPGLRAWFKAEHVEPPESGVFVQCAQIDGEGRERAADGDTEPQNADSRERLEADISKYLNFPSDCRAVYDYNAVIGWLDRQRAIDDSICEDCSSDFYKLQEEYDALIDEVDRLTAERDNLAADLVRANNERERYREKFGKCIDYADAIHALMDDEGLA